MPFNLNKIIIHEIQKDQGANEIDEFLSQESLDFSKATSFVAETLNRSFTKNNIYKGEFLPSSPQTVFRNYFETYMAEERTDADFCHFTRQVVHDLTVRLEDVTQAKGGYLVCTEYYTNDQTFLSIFLVRDTDRVLFNRNAATHSFSVQMTENVDTDKLAMACRINLPNYQQNPQGYLQFIRNHQAEVSQYFINWINAAQSTSSRDHTMNFVKLIEQVGTGFDEDGQQYKDPDEFHKDLSNYIKNTPGRLINLDDISQRFYQAEEFLQNFVDEHDINIDTEFTAHSTSLRRLNRFDFKYSSLQLKFSHGDWERETVRIIDDQVIINSTDLAQKIQQEMTDAGEDN